MKSIPTFALLFSLALPVVAAQMPRMFDPPAVRPPTALVADAADSSVILEWNANLEVDLAGYHVYRAEGDSFTRITKTAVAVTEFADTGLKNGTAARYRVSAVLKNGTESPQSNVAEATPRPTTPPEIVQGRATVTVPGYDPIAVPQAVSIVFENGNRIVFDKDLVRVRDWQAADGTHLLYPRSYGNPIDIAEMDEFGFSSPQPATTNQSALPPTLNLPYAMTGAGGGRGGRGNPAQSWWSTPLRPWWVGYEVKGNRVTLQYRIPVKGYRMPEDAQGGYWAFARIWETWWPVERTMPGGSRYQGLARKLEIELPSYYKEGYSVCLNDGFGVNGSSDGAVTYEHKWGGLTETHWKKDANMRGGGRPARQTQGYHPSEASTQVAPFQFARFPQGALILAPRHYYYSTSYSWANYVGQGQDGLWPNYAIDAAASGKRTRLESFEYLWNHDTTLESPQQFMDATFFYRRGLARLYGLQVNHGAFDTAWDAAWGPGAAAVAGKSDTEKLDVLRKWGESLADRAFRIGADAVGGAHELWTSSPYTTPDDIRLNLDHPINKAIADMLAAFRKQGVGFAYWVRPEFVKQPYPIAISPSFSTTYYGYVRQLFPPASPIVEKDGLALIRDHQEWIRLDRDGGHPFRTPYNWTPMSLTKKGWYEEVIYPTLVMMKQLGITTVFQDGGSSSLAGVDYTLGEARAVQPYYWRYYQDIYGLDLDLEGECTVGWTSSNVGNITAADAKRLWAFTMVNHRGNLDGAGRNFFTAEMRHISHQLYCGAYMGLQSDANHTAAARFAHRFVQDNGHPERVFLEGLKYDNDKQMWRWDNVWWEYAGGKRVRYPNYSEVVK
jgi:hypothetical protein